MKIYFSILFILLIGFNNAIPQRTKPLNYEEIDNKAIHFGFSMGINTFDYTFTLNAENVRKDSMIADVVRLNPGFNIGIVSSLRINDYVELRLLPGMTFAATYISYRSTKPDFSKEVKVEYYPIELPVALKLKSERINNYRPYLITDYTFRYNMAGYSKRAQSQDIIKINRFNMYYSIGFGVDYYFTFFRLSTELKMSFGVLDGLNKDAPAGYAEYTEIIDKMLPNLFFLTFHFE
jgi:hypothetical protein